MHGSRVLRLNVRKLHPRGSKYPIFKVSGPKHIPLLAFGARNLPYWVLGPSAHVREPDNYTATTGPAACLSDPGMRACRFLLCPRLNDLQQMQRASKT